ncbi:hypothetical protein Nos7524_3417 [Nostoc sp. PCC 7524]|nr:hypothetical protein [Nostoc sp. PCC 7524]AFY49210.1 hypothetical protein Nos7524_3417 [Nostoc sp. PCC 7524]
MKTKKLEQKKLEQAKRELKKIDNLAEVSAGGNVVLNPHHL